MTHVATEAADGNRFVVDVASSKTAPERRIRLHAHDYARISARIPAHVRGAVLAKAGVTGEFYYRQKHEDKPERFVFEWVPMTATRRNFGLGSSFLTRHSLKNMSDFALTGGVPQD